MKRDFELKASVVRWPLKEPFVISNFRWEEATALRVVITQGRFRGWAEGMPLFYKSETAEALLESVERETANWHTLPSNVEMARLPLPGGARNALDCALLHLSAQKQGVSIHSLMGTAPPKPVPALATLSLDTPLAMARQAAALPAITILKLKLDAEDIGGRLAAVRKARPHATLVIDANCGWSFDTLKSAMPSLVRHEVAMLEQPMPPEQDEHLEGFKSPIPLCADESCQDINDLDAVARRYQMINIKLDKCGGLTAALELARAARERGMELMVGNMLGSSLAMAPAFHVARQCRFSDLDGPLFLSQDMTPGMTFVSGHFQPVSSQLWG
ncbi:MAG: dipeptide epimerase [Pseudomonadota bacterium]